MLLVFSIYLLYTHKKRKKGKKKLTKCIHLSTNKVKSKFLISASVPYPSLFQRGINQLLKKKKKKKGKEKKEVLTK